MQADWFAGLQQEIGAVGDVDQLGAVCERLCDHLKIPHYCFAMRLPTSFVDPALLVFDNYPESFRDRYVDLDGLNVDPVLLGTYEQSAPVYWDEAFAEVEPDSAQARYVEGVVRALGIPSGVSCGYRGVRGQFAILSMASDDDSRGLQRYLRAVAPRVMLAGACLHDSATRLLVEDPAQAVTPRERQCLLWCAEGKTARETGELLDITERTVIFHLRNASAKLRVNSRQQAVARAVSLGIIEPRPVTVPTN
ncbi:LuxR family transcriptional regulator [Aquisalimonas sp.]|uniref:helix-turn-helix transcriptional regulator n=1 Tax=unclassified Aquisalimonas TaxID=2644645 RepID=UPI0025C45B4F|nr:LuxR family transcriptional regulator [Aquisalimonas sp.]